MLVVNNDTYINKYFRGSEFFTESVMAGEISEVLIENLYYLREAIKRPININSGYRSEAHNQFVGGVDDSYHLVGKAVDIAYRGRKHRNAIILHALEIGFTGIGIGRRFIHLDVRSKDLTVWTYSKK